MEKGKSSPPDGPGAHDSKEPPRPPPSVKRGRSGGLCPLSEQQRQFAEDQHALIYAFLRERRLPASEYYDVVALGYLHAVQRYLTQSALTRYQFSTIAWNAMRRSLSSFHRAEERRRESERRYMDTLQQSGIDPYLAMESRLLLHDLAAVSSKEQYALACLRLQGYSIAETAKAQGMSPKRVRRLLKELFRTYLQLCGT